MKPAWVIAVALAATTAASSTAAADPFQRVLTGSFGGRLSAARGAPEGWFLGVDTGRAWLLADDAMTSSARAAVADDSDSAWTFGARAGYQLRSGLAVQARYDRLDVASPAGGQLAVASAGVRYSLPIVPMPFAEALVGTAFDDADARVTVAVGCGASLLLARHVAFDAALRDWIVDIDGGIRNIPTLTIGITAGFDGR